MTEISFRPIDQWPDGWRDNDRDAVRLPTPFRAGYSDTLGLLDDELYHLDAVAAHVQLAGITLHDLRQDGRLRARAKVEHPGVIVTVARPVGPALVLGTDQFVAAWSHQGESWHHNFRACVLGLRDLRRMTRYGLNGGQAQYAGFMALPAGGPVALGSGMSSEEAALLLLAAAGSKRDVADVVHNASSRDAVYREAARRLHPDRDDGDAVRMADVNRARDVLVASHG